MEWLDFDFNLPITDPTWIFLLVLLIILFAPMVLGRLRIPHIIGMILAGVVIGEHGFNILARDSSFELFGKVGLYYIMFLAGLEMNMGDFKKNRGKAVVLGLLAFVIPMALGFVTNIEIWFYHIGSAGQYVRFPYAGCLSHRDSVWGVTPSQCQHCSGRYGGNGYPDPVGTGCNRRPV